MKIQHDNNNAARTDDSRVAQAWSDEREPNPKPSAATERVNESIDALSVYMSQIGDVALLTRLWESHQCRQALYADQGGPGHGGENYHGDGGQDANYSAHGQQHINLANGYQEV